ncbi:DNA repair protein RecN [Paraoerskovia marina]|uniref:DNA repair protein RecN n=1 Tax=Paraoerskovia marina TaxID=545619 RepID=UPI000AFF4DFC|nr:DNA repair protein RecN [Paraoerskovia marina]
MVIEDLGVISRTSVCLHPGLTVITGETGAGKTMLLTGLGLLMGGKADPASVRPGATRAVVEGRMHLPESSAAREIVHEAGGELDDDGSVVVVRSVAAEGRSRAHVGGRSVPQALLADVAGELVTVHGQADQIRLRTQSRQRDALDAFAGKEHAGTLAEYRRTWHERADVERRIEDLTTHADERAREAEALRRGLAEIERVDPQPGEDVDLTALVARLGNSEELRAAAQTAHLSLVGDESADASESAVVSLDRARRALEQVADSDPEMSALARRLVEAEYMLNDVASDLAAYVDGLQADPGGLESAHARLAELTTLTRTYGESIDDVLAWASAAGLKLLDLDDDGAGLDALRERHAELDAGLRRLADQVTEGRVRAARELDEAVSAELAGLAMTGARLSTAVEPADLSASGGDKIAMQLVPHPGAPPRPLGKGASGGELSRVMLAIEVALAATRGAHGGGPRTFVFDEVDAGVGGRAAVEVGRRLAQLAQRAQVIVVTHLAQVAAFADRQLVVAKDTTGGSTVTGVSEVTDDARVSELARMLSGQDDSSTALRHAHELLESSTVQP